MSAATAFTPGGRERDEHAVEHPVRGPELALGHVSRDIRQGFFERLDPGLHGLLDPVTHVEELRIVRLHIPVRLGGWVLHLADALLGGLDLAPELVLNLSISVMVHLDVELSVNLTTIVPPCSAYSPPISSPFSATERFIRNTRSTSPRHRTANSQKTSK